MKWARSFSVTHNQKLDKMYNKNILHLMEIKIPKLAKKISSLSMAVIFFYFIWYLEYIHRASQNNKDSVIKRAKQVTYEFYLKFL